MDHFARPDDELARARRDRTLHRNFQGYTTKAGTDLFGLGMSAIGSVGDAYVQNRRGARRLDRRAVERDGAATFRGFRLSADDRLRRTVIQNLLCHGVVVKTEIEAAFGIRLRRDVRRRARGAAPVRGGRPGRAPRRRRSARRRSAASSCATSRCRSTRICRSRAGRRSRCSRTDACERPIALADRDRARSSSSSSAGPRPSTRSRAFSTGSSRIPT